MLFARSKESAEFKLSHPIAVTGNGLKCVETDRSAHYREFRPELPYDHSRQQAGFKRMNIRT
jgi:hypothetical protein